MARMISLAGLVVVFTLTAAGARGTESRCLACHEAHHRQQGRCTVCHLGDSGAMRKALAHHDLIRGAAAAWHLPDSPVLDRAEAMRDSLGCRRCHVTGGKGGHLAINLDAIVRERSQEQLREALQQPAAAMPRFGLTTAQIDTLIALLLRDGNPDPPIERYRVRFQGSPPDTLPVFTRLCGDCHRALSPRGPLGGGDVGPDLSGLTGDDYSAAPDDRWDAERLTKWLANPRALRPATTMPPVTVTDGELKSILRELATFPVR